MNTLKGARHRLENGQGLAEYAMVIILVGVIVILIMVVLGVNIQKQFCEVVYTVDPGAEIPTCEIIDVSCTYTTGSHWINLEAVVTDHVGEDDVEKVIFSNNGLFAEDEFYVPYCLGSNPNGQPCNRYHTSPGTHTIVAVATDADGNTGKCEVTVDVP